MGVAIALLCVVGYLCYLYDQTDRNPAVRQLFYALTVLNEIFGHKKTHPCSKHQEKTYLRTSPSAIVGIARMIKLTKKKHEFKISLCCSELTVSEVQTKEGKGKRRIIALQYLLLSLSQPLF